ncbi:uncharacterized protein LOC144146833 [Haemaphysalis longicornis]
MRMILLAATLAPLFMTGHAGFWSNVLFCKSKCNPNPEQPLQHCAFSCGWKLGKYYDGSACWILGRIGNHYRWKGNCKNGICVRSTNGYRGSKAETRCGPITTTQVSVVTTPTTANVIPGTKSNASETDAQADKPYASLPVQPASGMNNDSANMQSTPPTTSSSITTVQEVTSTAENQTGRNDDLQKSSDDKSSPTAPVETATSTTEAHNNTDAATPVVSANKTLSGNPAESPTPKKDGTGANASIESISTTGTSSTTEVQTEGAPSEETTEIYTIGTRTYPPRPKWLVDRFKSTTTQITAGATSSTKGPSTTEAPSGHDRHTVSSKDTETSETTQKTEATSRATNETVMEMSSYSATSTTPAISSASNRTC